MYIFKTNTVMAKNIGTFGKYDQRLKMYLLIVNPFDLL